MLIISPLLIDPIKMFFKRNLVYSSILILIVIGGHLITLSYPGINFEFSFADASNYFLTRDPELLDRYFKYQANTLALPYISSLILNVIPITNPLIAIRLLNLVGISLLAIGITFICKYLKKDALIPSVLALTLFNPLIWAFSGRATADFFPMALGIFCISIPLFNKNKLILLLAGCLFGLACAIKYHTLCLLVIGASLLYVRSSNFMQEVKLIYLFLLPSFIVLFSFLTLIFLEFGYWIVPQSVVSEHSFKLTLNFIDNFFGYFGLLSLLSLPFIALSVDFYKSVFFNRKFLLLALALLIFVLSIAVKDHGEMNLGPLDQFISPSQRIYIYLAMSVVTLITLFYPIDNKSKYQNFLSLSLFFIILVFSFARPAQRYLLPLIPFYLIAIPPSYLSKKIVYSTLALFFLAIIFIENSRLNTAKSALEIVQKINEQNLLKVTSPGVITSHVGNLFNFENDSIAIFTIVYGQRGDAIISVRSGSIIFTSKTLSVVPISNTP